MAHETYLTTRDKMAASVGESSRGITVSWGALTLGLGVAAALVSTPALAIGLALGAAVTGFKTVKSFAQYNFSGKPTASKSTARQESADAAQTTTPNLANNLDPVPQVADDVPSEEWRKQVAERAARQASSGRF